MTIPVAARCRCGCAGDGDSRKLSEVIKTVAGAALWRLAHRPHSMAMVTRARVLGVLRPGPDSMPPSHHQSAPAGSGKRNVAAIIRVRESRLYGKSSHALSNAAGVPLNRHLVGCAWFLVVAIRAVYTEDSINGGVCVRTLEPIIRDYADKLVPCGHPVGVVLFGSHARGTATPDSDIDLLVIDTTPDERHRRSIMYPQALRPRMVPVDLIVLTSEEIIAPYHRRVPFVVDVLREGRWVYGDSGRAGLSDIGAR